MELELNGGDKAVHQLHVFKQQQEWERYYSTGEEWILFYFAVDTVEQPQTEDQGCAETRPQDCSHINLRRGVARSMDLVLFEQSQGKQMQKDKREMFHR